MTPLAADLPGPDEAIQDAYQLIDGKTLSTSSQEALEKSIS